MGAQGWDRGVVDGAGPLDRGVVDGAGHLDRGVVDDVVDGCAGRAALACGRASGGGRSFPEKIAGSGPFTGLSDLKVLGDQVQRPRPLSSGMLKRAPLEGGPPLPRTSDPRTRGLPRPPAVLPWFAAVRGRACPLPG